MTFTIKATCKSCHRDVSFHPDDIVIITRVGAPILARFEHCGPATEVRLSPDALHDLLAAGVHVMRWVDVAEPHDESAPPITGYDVLAARAWLSLHDDLSEIAS